MWSLLLAFSMGVFVNAGTIIGYDCTDVKSNYTEVDLYNIKECRYPEDEEVSESEVDIQVISRRRFNNVTFVYCNVVYTRVMYYCGSLSHAFMMPNHLREYRVEFTPDECLEVHRLRRFQLGDLTFNDLRIGEERRESIQLAGGISNNGVCSHEKYQDGATYNHVTVSGHIVIKLGVANGRIPLNSKIISGPGGFTCNRDTKERCLHPYLGFLGWKMDDYEVCGPYSRNIPYEGKAKLITYEMGVKTERYIMINQGNRIAALRLREPSYVCSVESVKTEFDDIEVIFRGHSSIPFYFKKRLSDPADVSLTNYINTKFLFLEQYFSQSMTALKSEILYTLCQNRRRILENRLAVALHDANQYALLEHGIGYTGLRAGEVIYIMKCQPVQVVLRSEKRCYMDIPVSYKDRPMFVLAGSRILKNLSSEVECSIRLPSLFKIGSDWLSLSPFSVSRAPHMLDPNEIEFNWTYHKLWNFGIAGLYGQDMVRSLERLMMMEQTVGAATTYLARKASGQSADMHGLNMNGIVDNEVIYEDIVGRLSLFWRKLIEAGSIFSAILLTFTIFKLIIMVINIIFDGISLFKVYGCTCMLFGALSSGLTRFLIDLFKMDRKLVKPEHRNIANIMMESGNDVEMDLQHSTLLPGLSVPVQARQYPALMEVDHVPQNESRVTRVNFRPTQ